MERFTAEDVARLQAIAAVAALEDSQFLTALAERLPVAVELAPFDDYDDFGKRFGSLRDVRQTRALNALLHGANIKTACAAAGVKYASWYRWRHEDDEFEALYQQVVVTLATKQLEDVDEVEKNLIERAKEETDAAKVVLRAYKPERYRERQTIEVVSPDVIGRLEQQASAILEACHEALEDRATAGLVASTIANRLRVIWQ